MTPVGTRFTFQSPYEQFAERRGTEAEVIGHVTEADDQHDEEVLPMYRVRFTADGLVTEAWPEEVEG